MNPRPRPARSRARTLSATVLLEVLLAVALFVVASAIVTSSLNAALRSLDRQKLQLHASNLAASALAEIQLGARPSTPSPAQPLPQPLQDWSLEVSADSAPNDFSTNPPLQLVSVVVRHRSEPVVQRLSARLAPVAPIAAHAAFPDSNP